MRRGLYSAKKLSSQMVLYIKDNSRMAKDTDLVSKYGQMEPDTKACGEIMLPQAEENSSILMEIFMMVRISQQIFFFLQ